MPTFIVCLHCGKKLQVSEAELGKQVVCPTCEGLIVAGESTPAQVEAPESAPALVSEIRVQPVAPAPHRANEERREEPASRPRAEASRGRKVRPSSQLGLRSLVLVCGFLGAAAAGFLAYEWREAEVETKVFMDLARQLKVGQTGSPFGAEMEEFDSRGEASPRLFVTAALSVFGAAWGFWRFGLVGGPLMLGAVVGPAIYVPKSLLFTALVAFGGLLCFLVQSRGRAIAAAERATLSGRGRSPALIALGIAVVCIAGLAVLGCSAFLGYVAYVAVEKQRKNLDELRVAANPPRPASNLSGATRSPDPASQAKAPVQEIASGSIEADIERAAAGVKLVKLDLAPTGWDLSIDVPEGCKFKESYGVVTITKDARFALKIQLGRAG